LDASDQINLRSGVSDHAEHFDERVGEEINRVLHERMNKEEQEA
jgi:hypothetical protein